ncbi:response regulator [Paenibacillus gansuensis]|uniref:Response regulator n=1 Tax=Paenibacillus gansuensis TaxID=306542 RepID=A0ABW5PAR7_9BACL
MNTIFLVEDEMLELTLLKEHMDWTGMDVCVIGTARNGRRAWEQIQTLQPDIILTDVRMPIMDGIQLGALVQERYPWIQVVYLSGHDEFSYVKSALESGAVGYLLKPVDPNELAAVMNRAKTEAAKVNLVRKSKQLWIDRHMELLLKTTEDSDVEQSWQELTASDSSVSRQLYVTALICPDPDRVRGQDPDSLEMVRILHKELEAGGLEGAVASPGPGEWAFAVASGSPAETMQFWERVAGAIHDGLGVTVTIGICEREGILRELPRMAAEARKAAGERFYLGASRIIQASGVVDPSPDPGPDSEILEMHREVLRLMTLQQLPEAGIPLDEYYRRMADTRVPREIVLSHSRELLQELSGELTKYAEWKERGHGHLPEWTAVLEECGTMEEIRLFLTGLVERITAFMAEKQQDRQSQLVRQVTAILESEYGEVLTIDELAGRVYLSPNYLRALFKEKMGCTIHDYLTKVRLERALEMLRDRGLKIQDVSKRVGYDNTSYFCSIFYKTQGVTPNEYRKKYL